MQKKNPIFFYISERKYFRPKGKGTIKREEETNCWAKAKKREKIKKNVDLVLVDLMQQIYKRIFGYLKRSSQK